MIAADAPQLVLDGWSAWLTFIGLACGTLVGAATTWRKVIRPMLRVGAVIEEAFPVWVKIAKRYADDDGGEVLSAELSAIATNQAAAADNQRLMVAKLDEGLAKLDELHDYSHRMRHDIVGNVAQLQAAFGTTTTIVDALVDVAHRLEDVRQQLSDDSDERDIDRRHDNGTPGGV